VAFTYSISTNVGKCRFTIGDTTSGAGVLPAGGNFTDEEVETSIALAGDWQHAAIYLLRVAAGRWGVKASSLSVGDYSESRQQVANLTALADTLEAKLPGGWSGMGLGTSTAANPAVLA